MLGCSDPEATQKLQLALEPGAEVIVDSAQTRQSIAGFGASSAWTAQGMSDAEADLFFSREVGLGLSLLRLRISPEGSTWENQSAQKAYQRGVAVWAAPWSPPGIWKSNGSDVYGGYLLPEHYQDWADRLAQFAATKQLEGIPLLGISAQNEPDWVAEWETCEWTPEELTTFIRDYLGPTLRAEAPGTQLIAPEVANWDSLAAYADALLEDEAAASEVDIVAVHSYGGKPYDYEPAAAAGKPLWETEVSYHEGTGLEAALYTALAIHDHFTVASVSAFHYWWLKSDEGASLLRDGVLVPQAYALAHFSKFVRPDYVRVELGESDPAAVLQMSAYWGAAEGQLVIVAINQGSSAIERSFRFDGFEPVTVTPWLTNSEVTLREQARQIVKNPFSYSFGRSSITTLVTGLEAETIGAGGAPPQSEGGAGGAEPEPEPEPPNTDSSGSGGTSSSTGGSGAEGGTSPGDSSTSKGGSSGASTNGDPPFDRFGKGPYSCGCDMPGSVNGRPLVLALFFGAAAIARRLRASGRGELKSNWG